MPYHGFVRVAAGSPRVKVADCRFNAEESIALLSEASCQGVEVIVLPEMGLTGYTCHDLFFQRSLQDAAIAALRQIQEATRSVFDGLVAVGMPLVVDDQVFNCAVLVQQGHLLGIVPKTYLPTYKEYYDARYFAPGSTAISKHVEIMGKKVPFGTDLLFTSYDTPSLTVGVEICEDLWVPIPPSCLQAYHGATLLLNLSASNETIGKAAYRRQLVASQSARCIAGYLYSSAGIGESTQDLVFGGHCLIAENGTILAESKRYQTSDSMVVADIDIDRLRANRQVTTSFSDGVLIPGLKQEFRHIAFRCQERTPNPELLRAVDPHPFVPSGESELRERCEEIFLIQVTGLGQRLEHIGKPTVSIGVSGGLDSTLALLVLCKTFDRLSVPRSRIRALTMPGFGTTGRTYENAVQLMRALGVPFREIDIRPLCLAEMKALGHAPFGIDLQGLDVETLSSKLGEVPAQKRSDLTFENVQARIRTSLLMNTAFVVGTGDLSELALGWCTYNADHMNMYNPNVSIPKTLVKFLVRWAAENEFDGEARRTLLDIVATEISPELLPTGKDGQVQSTESAIGPYELHDFFLFHFLRFGTSPRKILFLARHAMFDRAYTESELRHWLRVFLKRFFVNQFKRSCLPDGPKVGSVTLSPRGDWRMPSDAAVRGWLAEINEPDLI